jgi:hypothetical protein
VACGDWTGGPRVPRAARPLASRCGPQTARLPRVLTPKTISSSSPFPTPVPKMREKLTQLHLQQFTHLHPHYQGTGFSSLTLRYSLSSPSSPQANYLAVFSTLVVPVDRASYASPRPSLLCIPVGPRPPPPTPTSVFRGGADSGSADSEGHAAVTLLGARHARRPLRGGARHAQQSPHRVAAASQRHAQRRRADLRGSSSMEMRWRRWQVVLLLAVLVSRSRPAEAARASWAWRTRRRPGTGACGSAGNSNPNSRLDPAATARCVQRKSIPPPPPRFGRQRDARWDRGPTA